MIGCEVVIVLLQTVKTCWRWAVFSPNPRPLQSVVRWAASFVIPWSLVQFILEYNQSDAHFWGSPFPLVFPNLPNIISGVFEWRWLVKSGQKVKCWLCHFAKYDIHLGVGFHLLDVVQIFRPVADNFIWAQYWITVAHNLPLTLLNPFPHWHPNDYHIEYSITD